MRILFLISGKNVPSSRYRVLAYLPYLRAQGHVCHVAASFPAKYDYIRWIGWRASRRLQRWVRWGHCVWARLGRYDVVVLERELFDDDTWTVEQKLRLATSRLVLDLDDAVFLRYPKKIEELCRLSDLVIAGNPLIEKKVAAWNSNTVVIPTAVDMNCFPAKRCDTHVDRLPIVGWIGTTANLAYIEVIAPALRRLARRCNFEMRFIVPEIGPLNEIDLSGVRTRHVAWRPDTEVSELHRIDIGVMPLFDDREWDEYKCPTKVVQYMAVGVPPVASPVGFTADVITHGVDGFLAASEEDWENILHDLIERPQLRARIGRAARKTAAAKYSVQANAPLLLAALTTLSDTTAPGFPPISADRSQGGSCQRQRA